MHNRLPQYSDSDAMSEEDEEESPKHHIEISHKGRAIDSMQCEAFKRCVTWYFHNETLTHSFYSYFHQIKPEQQRPKRNRLACNCAMYAEWEAQAPDILTAFLEWKVNPQPTLSSPDFHEPPSSPEAAMSSNVPPAPQDHFFDVTVVDIKGKPLQNPS